MSLLATLIPSVSRTVPEVADRGPVRKPVYEIAETAEVYDLTVHLPAVSKDGLEITAEGNELRIVGKPAWKQPESWAALYRESTSVPFELTLTHDNVVDVGKIHAELKDGTLRLSLPKAESLKPRKIAVS